DGATPSFAGGRLMPIDETDLVDVDRGTGDITVDLRRLELGDDADLTIEVGAGAIEVLVPDRLNVEINATVGSGEVNVFGSNQGGFGNEVSITRADNEGAPILTLDLSAT